MLAVEFMMSAIRPRQTDDIVAAQWVLPVSGPPIENGYVRIENGKIAAVGPLSELPEGSYSSPQPGSILSPGLINTHIHLEQSFPAPIEKSPDEPFNEWLGRVVQRYRTATSRDDFRIRCEKGAEELLRTGTTCVNDIASGTEALEVLEERGLRGIVSLEIFHPAFDELNVERIMIAYTHFRDNFRHHRLLQAGLSPHSAYNVSPRAWQAVVDACEPPLIHTHVAEFEDEVRYLRGEPSPLVHMHRSVLGRDFSPQRPASSPVQYLAEFNLLNNRTVMAHAVEVQGDDHGLIAEAGCTVAHCPRSNLALHGKTLAPQAWPEDIPVGLGTDGRLSTENLDLRAEARLAIQLHGWSYAEALRRLTWTGAQVLFMSDRIGTLESGKEADLVLWQAEPGAEGSPEALLLMDSTRVKQVRVAGQIRWEAT